MPTPRAVQQGFHFLPLSVFQKQGLRYAIEKLDFSFLAFTPSAPEHLRAFDQIGYVMRLFLPATDDVADPLVGSFRQIGLSVAKAFDWQALDEATKRGLTVLPSPPASSWTMPCELCGDRRWVALHDGWRPGRARSRITRRPRLKPAWGEHAGGRCIGTAA